MKDKRAFLLDLNFNRIQNEELPFVEHLRNNRELRSKLFEEYLKTEKKPWFAMYITIDYQIKRNNNQDFIPKGNRKHPMAGFFEYSDYELSFKEEERKYNQKINNNELEEEYFYHSIKDTEFIKNLSSASELIKDFEQSIFNNLYENGEEFAEELIDSLDMLNLPKFKYQILEEFLSKRENSILQIKSYLDENISKESERYNELKTKHKKLKRSADRYIKKILPELKEQIYDFDSGLRLPIPWDKIAYDFNNKLKYQNRQDLTSVFQNSFIYINLKFIAYHNEHKIIPIKRLRQEINQFRIHFPKDENRISGVNYYDDLIEIMISQVDTEYKLESINYKGDFLEDETFNFFKLILDYLKNHEPLDQINDYLYPKYKNKEDKFHITPSYFLNGIEKVLIDFNQGIRDRINEQKDELYQVIDMRKKDGKPYDDIKSHIRGIEKVNNSFNLSHRYRKWSVHRSIYESEIRILENQFEVLKSIIYKDTNKPILQTKNQEIKNSIISSLPKTQKYYALYYWMKLNSKGELPPVNPEGDFIKKDIKNKGSEILKEKKDIDTDGQSFYKEFVKIQEDLNNTKNLNNKFGKNWKEIILDIAKNEPDIISYIKNKYK